MIALLKQTEMIITINEQVIETPSDHMTVRDILEWRNIPEAGTAVAVNGRLIPRSRWNSEELNEHDDITLISAAFGG